MEESRLFPDGELSPTDRRLRGRMWRQVWTGVFLNSSFDIAFKSCCEKPVPLQCSHVSPVFYRPHAQPAHRQKTGSGFQGPREDTWNYGACEVKDVSTGHAADVLRRFRSSCSPPPSPPPRQVWTGVFLNSSFDIAFKSCCEKPVPLQCSHVSPVFYRPHAQPAHRQKTGSGFQGPREDTGFRV